MGGCFPVRGLQRARPQQRPGPGRWAHRESRAAFFTHVIAHVAKCATLLGEEPLLVVVGLGPACRGAGRQVAARSTRWTLQDTSARRRGGFGRR